MCFLTLNRSLKGNANRIQYTTVNNSESRYPNYDIDELHASYFLSQADGMYYNVKRCGYK